MRPARKGKAWRETHVRLTEATATVFDGPAGAFTIVVHGTRAGAARVTRQREDARRRQATKGGRHGS